MAKFGNIYIVNLHEKHIPFSKKSKDIIRESGTAYKKQHKLTKASCFTNRPSESDEFTLLGKNSLSSVTMNDKLYICAHADTKEVGPYKAEKLAEKLYDWGLREVKLVSFKACEVGKGDFLSRFVEACRGKIKVGWVKGYTGAAGTVTWKGKSREEITVGKEEVTGHDKRRLRLIPGTEPNVPLEHWFIKGPDPSLVRIR